MEHDIDNYNTPRVPHKAGRFPAVQVVLFVATFISTLVAGMLQRGINPLTQPDRYYEGLPFSLTLLTILGSHELAHYAASRVHHMNASLPYFIPAPSMIGTFGAFIKMSGSILSRRALIDIGASGPIVGFIVSVIAAYVGLGWSEIVVSKVPGADLVLGQSLIFGLITKATLGTIAGGRDVLLHPVAFAGWIGLLITSLNLLPVGQLDGGHVLYAMVGPGHNMVSRVMLTLLVIMGVVWWQGWIVWAVLLLVLGPKHPPVMSWEIPLPYSRRYTAYACLAILVLTFIPTPFIFN